MRLNYGRLGFREDLRYCTIPEARMVEMLVLYGWAHDVESPEARSVLKEKLRHWTTMGLGFGKATDGERLFDPVEVINFLIKADLDGWDEFWSERNITTARRLATDLVDRGRSGPSSLTERSFEIDFQRKYDLRRVAAGTQLRLRAPLPLEGDYLRDLQVTPFARMVDGVKVDVRPGRLELRMVASGQAEVMIGAKLKFIAGLQEPDQGRRPAENDRNLYLLPRESLIVVSERISNLARSLAGPNASAVEAVRVFWDYIQDEIFFGGVHYDLVDLAAPGDWVLDSGWADCQLGSALLIALCRASGIPARIIGGQCLFPKSPFKHYWAEVWMDPQGWVPFDFHSWNLSRGGRDSAWRDYYFGRLDYRLVTERLPKEFVGVPGVPVPSAWNMIQVPAPGGLEMDLMGIDGARVYADTVCVVS